MILKRLRQKTCLWGFKPAGAKTDDTNKTTCIQVWVPVIVSKLANIIKNEVQNFKPRNCADWAEQIVKAVILGT